MPTRLGHKLELYIPSARMPKIRPHLPPDYTEQHVIGHWAGQVEPVVIVTIYHTGECPLAYDVVCALLELGEHSVLSVEDGIGELWTKQLHEVLV